MNYILTCINQDVNIHLFADDSLLFKSIINVNDQASLIESLEGVLTPCNLWCITPNSDEAVLIRITKKMNHLEYKYTVINAPVSLTNSFKYLGTITLNLS